MHRADAGPARAYRRSVTRPPADRSRVAHPRPREFAVHIGVLLLSAVGVIALWRDLATTWRIVTAVTVAVVAGIRLLPLTRRLGRPGTIIEYAGAAIGVVVIPVFALLGTDAVLAQVGIGPVLSPPARLVIGAAIVLIVARVSLEPFWTDHELPRPWLLAAGAMAGLVFLPGLVIALIGQINGDGRTLAQRPAASHLDVVVLRADAPPPAPPTTRVGSWQIDTWTGQIEGDRIVWAGGRRPALDGESDAERVLVLLPPAADNDTPARWLALADRVEPRATPTYAVLDDPTDRQLGRWRTPLSETTGRTGGALRRSDLSPHGTPSAADLGLLAVTRSPSASGDLALAVAHRPILRFDSGERFHRPLDVDALFGQGLISMCEGGQKLRDQCVRLHGAGDLQRGFSHLAFDSGKLATADVASPIYVHVTRTAPDGSDADGLIHLDYWWYLPDNPAGSGSGAFCGPGFSIGGVTCFDHQSDWEGVTVVLNARHPAASPVAVSYAQHDGTVRYTWPALQRLWQLTRAERFAPDRALVTRPLVFSARGTHASYPIPCDRASCPRRAAPTLPNTALFQDTRHDGGKLWTGATDDGCASACVALLATSRDGAEPEGWNGWPGIWGTANCVAGVFCASAQPPRSPGEHERYREPWCAKTAFGLRGDRFVSVPACSTTAVAVGDGTRGGRLLALGDSYSSGEGAGDYQAGTDGGDNSCHRSRNAWPALLAHERGLAMVPSIACSGATLTDLLSGRAGSSQSERAVSQLARVSGTPSIVTVTVGGNDLGFRSILENCIAVDCVARYHRASGDVLDARIDALARRLPDAYRAIQAAAPKARVFVVDYPRLFPDGQANCAALRRITPTEGDYLNGKIERADIAILDAARKAGVTGIDVSTALRGGELTCSGTQYLNHASARLKLLSASFHPNAAGQQRIARAVAAALADLGR
jgi:lysophospholipase L1-like esterase